MFDWQHQKWENSIYPSQQSCPQMPGFVQMLSITFTVTEEQDELIIYVQMAKIWHTKLVNHQKCCLAYS